MTAIEIKYRFDNVVATIDVTTSAEVRLKLKPQGGVGISSRKMNWDEAEKFSEDMTRASSLAALMAQSQLIGT